MQTILDKLYFARWFHESWSCVAERALINLRHERSSRRQAFDIHKTGFSEAADENSTTTNPERCDQWSEQRIDCAPFSPFKLAPEVCFLHWSKAQLNSFLSRRLLVLASTGRFATPLAHSETCLHKPCRVRGAYVYTPNRLAEELKHGSRSVAPSTDLMAGSNYVLHRWTAIWHEVSPWVRWARKQRRKQNGSSLWSIITSIYAENVQKGNIYEPNLFRSFISYKPWNIIHIEIHSSMNKMCINAEDYKAWQAFCSFIYASRLHKCRLNMSLICFGFYRPEWLLWVY